MTRSSFCAGMIAAALAAAWTASAMGQGRVSAKRVMQDMSGRKGREAVERDDERR